MNPVFVLDRIIHVFVAFLILKIILGDRCLVIPILFMGKQAQRGHLVKVTQLVSDRTGTGNQ